MNVAFPAIVAFLMLLPGIIFVRLRRPKLSSEPPPFTPISAEAALIATSAIAAHAAWVAVCGKFLEWVGSTLQPEPKSVLMLLAGRSGNNDTIYDSAANSLANHPYPVLGYFITLYLLMALLAWRYGQRFDDSMRRIGMLPPEGRESEWREFFRDGQNVLAIVTTVVDLGGTAYLFVGRLENLWFDQKTGELDRFAISDVWRRKIEANQQPVASRPDTATQAEDALRNEAASALPQVDLTAEQIIAGEYDSIEGDLFVIKYSDAKTVNVRYFLEE